MLFATRAVSGFVLTSVTVALLGAAGWQIYSSVSGAEKRKRPPARERSYIVDVDIVKLRNVEPQLTAYGRVLAGRTLEIRAPGAGLITEMSSNMRNGRSVAAGELLFRVEPETFERRVVDARAGLTQAKLELSEATASKRHLSLEIQAAELQERIRRDDLARKRDLHAKKLVTSTSIDESKLAVLTAEQAVVAKQQALIALESRTAKARAGVERAELTLRDAEKTLADASYRAPFSGRISEVALSLGRRVNQNEKLAVLIDPNNLEVSFPVRNGEFGRLVDPKQPDKVRPLAVKVSMQLDRQSVTIEGQLDRPDAIAASQTGRIVYARLDGKAASVLRPGDFVRVNVTEPQLANVAVIPVDASTIDGRVLLVGRDNRLVEQQVDVLRQQTTSLVVRGLANGMRVVRRRLPYLANSIRVAPRARADDASPGQVAAKPRQPATERISLDPKRRAALIAHVKSRSRMPAHRRQRLLEELKKAEPSRRIIERLEQRMSRSRRRS